MKNLTLTLSLAAALTTSASAVTMTMTNAIGGAIVGSDFQVATIGTVAAANNHPAGEPPSAVLDANSGTKYLNFREIDTGIIVTPDVLSAGLRLDTLTFTTANDAANRDPLTFTLYGSATQLTGGGPFALGSLTPIVTGASTGLTVDPGRFVTGAPQTFTNNTAFASYLLVFPTVRDAATANSMQIADVAFGGSVPEPASAGLVGLALLGLARRRR